MQLPGRGNICKFNRSEGSKIKTLRKNSKSHRSSVPRFSGDPQTGSKIRDFGRFVIGRATDKRNINLQATVAQLVEQLIRNQ